MHSQIPVCQVCAEKWSRQNYFPNDFYKMVQNVMKHVETRIKISQNISEKTKMADLLES